MSNFLNNLAARSLDRAEVVRPRLASAFELPRVRQTAADTRAGAGAEYEVSEESLHEYVSEIVRGNAPGVAQLVGPPSQRLSLARPHLELPKTSADLEDLSANRVDHAVEQPVRALRPNPPTLPRPASPDQDSAPKSVSEARPRAAYNTADRDREHQAMQSSLQPVIDRIRGERPRESEAKPQYIEPSGHGQDMSPIIPPSFESESAQGRLSGTSGPRFVSSAIIGRSARSAPSVMAPSTAVHDREAPMLPVMMHTHAREAPPAVRITIGRIEVRAIMPSSPAPRTTPAPKQPPLSLDEYLKQRGGGRR